MGYHATLENARKAIWERPDENGRKGQRPKSVRQLCLFVCNHIVFSSCRHSQLGESEELLLEKALD
jgi:hypothetical protein